VVVVAAVAAVVVAAAAPVFANLDGILAARRAAAAVGSSRSSYRSENDKSDQIMEFPQRTIAQIIDSEREMVLTAPQRYGMYYDTAFDCAMLFTQFLKSIDPDRWVFGSFLSLAKKHHTLALFSTVRLHKVQALMNLRQTLEAGACAAFAIANPDHAHFVDTDEYGILDPVPAGKRYRWLDQNYPASSTAINEIKKQINTSTAHANLISTHSTFRTDYEAGWFTAPFFDIEDEHYVKTDLWMIANAALTLLHFLYEVNEGRNVIKFVDNFWPLIQPLDQRSGALRAEMMATDRVKRALEKDAARKAGATQGG